MARLSSDITDETLLCERCGYVLEGLDERGACPECGQAIAESLPSRRTGTPFQVSPGWRGFVTQCKMLAQRPTELFGNVRVSSSPGVSIAADAFNIAALIALIPPAWRAWLEFRAGPSLLAGVVSLGCLLLVWYCIRQVMVMLTWIERVGVVFFSRRRGWRIGRALAQAICGNAAPGWIAAAVLMNLGFALAFLVDLLKPVLPLDQWAVREAIKTALPLLGFVAGMLIFETLVYIGVRRCKYANWVERPVRGEGPATAAQSGETHSN